MTAQFPTTVYTPRVTENLPGITYDATQKQNMFSEDFQNLGNEINAIETWLLGQVKREVLTADRTYYVRTDGNDSHNGLANTSAGAFLTIQHAIDVCASLDTSIYNIIIQLGAGTYSTTTTVLKNILGSGTVTISGDLTTPSNVILNQGIWKSTPGTTYIIQGVKFQKTTTNAIYAIYTTEGGKIIIDKLEFGTGWDVHIQAETNSNINAYGKSYKVIGAPSYSHIQVVGNAVVNCGWAQITVVGNVALACFVYSAMGGLFLSNSTTYTLTGTPTGYKYNVYLNGVILSGVTLPGNVAGVTSSGGQYS